MTKDIENQDSASILINTDKIASIASNMSFVLNAINELQKNREVLKNYSNSLSDLIQDIRHLQADTQEILSNVDEHLRLSAMAIKTIYTDIFKNSSESIIDQDSTDKRNNNENNV